MPPAPIFGLRPEYPEPRNQKIDSRQPRLRWEAFPRPADLKADSNGWVARIQHVTYDVRIWRTVEGAFGRPFPGNLIYSRDSVPEPSHTVETPLAPDTSYVWTVRARFELDRQERITEWSMLRFPYDGPAEPRLPQIPPFSYYRFRTP